MYSVVSAYFSKFLPQFILLDTEHISQQHDMFNEDSFSLADICDWCSGQTFWICGALLDQASEHQQTISFAMTWWGDGDWSWWGDGDWSWWGDGDWSWSGGDWRGGGGLSPHTDTGKGKGQQQGTGKGKGNAQEQGTGKGKGATAEAAGGTGKGKGAAAATAAGTGKDGGVSPFGNLTGQEWIRQKGKASRRAYQAAQKAPKETAAAQRRQQRSEYYAAQVRGGVSPQAEPEEIPHSMSIPWPHSFKELGAEFMQHWQNEGDERGFSLRLAGWRNSQWKEDAGTCASMYRLRITQKEKKPDPDGAVQLFFEFSQAAKVHARENGLGETSLPWQELIEWWDGQVDDGAHTVEFSRLQDGQDTRVVMDRSGQVAAVVALGGVSPTQDADAVNIEGSVDPHKLSRALYWRNFSGMKKHRSRSVSRRRSHRAASAPPARHVPPLPPARHVPPLPSASELPSAAEQQQPPKPHVVPPRADKTPPPAAASPAAAPAPQPQQQQQLQPQHDWEFWGPRAKRAPSAPPPAAACPCAAVPAPAPRQGPSAEAGARGRSPPPQPAASSSGPVPAHPLPSTVGWSGWQEGGPQCQATRAEAWKTLTEEALRCAERIQEEGSGVGLPPDWMQQIHAAVAKGPDEKATWISTACPRCVLCIPTFKRDWQVTQVLPINLVLAWELRDHCIFVVADLNKEFSDDMSLLFKKCDVASQEGLLRHFRRLVPEEDGFTHWHASIGKNTAHVCGTSVAPKSILVNLDNDNFVSRWFFEDIYGYNQQLMEGSLAGLRWRHPSAPPCTGRIGGLSPRYQHAGASSNFVSCLLGRVSGMCIAITFSFMLVAVFWCKASSCQYFQGTEGCGELNFGLKNEIRNTTYDLLWRPSWLAYLQGSAAAATCSCDAAAIGRRWRPSDLRTWVWNKPSRYHGDRIVRYLSCSCWHVVESV